ncbi:MAG: bifunctional riboflavin kinase/FAD synthetase [Bacteroidales bacterium]|nr:bifunctional riboflavin kinase/FAD synthetase [Bacteroidales bacterium]
MNVFQGSNLPHKLKNPVVTVGTFDGVHRGHQALFDKMKEMAVRRGGETLVITFNTHPRIVLNHRNDIRLLNTFEEKISLIEKSGIENVWVLPFTRSFAELSAARFVEDYLAQKAGVNHFIVGYDHTFGKGGKAHYSELEALADNLGFSIEKIEAIIIDEKIVGSTTIREALIAGDIPEANKLLGYHYPLTGRIVRGNQIGKLIGYPTANLSLTDSRKLIPATGVYACIVDWKGNHYKGMGNIGYRPTIDANQLTIEANIFDFDREIYNDHITIRFIERIRDERKFGGLQQLKGQLGYDKEMVLKLFGENSVSDEF